MASIDECTLIPTPAFTGDAKTLLIFLSCIKINILTFMHSTSFILHYSQKQVFFTWKKKSNKKWPHCIKLFPWVRIRFPNYYVNFFYHCSVLYGIRGRYHCLFKQGFGPLHKLMEYEDQRCLGLFLLELKRQGKSCWRIQPHKLIHKEKSQLSLAPSHLLRL